MTLLIRVAEKVFPWFAAAFSLTFAWIGFDELRQPPYHPPSVLFAFALAVLFGVSAASIWFQWRIGRLAALVCGICLTWFTVNSLMGSWAKVSVPMAIALVVISGVAAVLALLLVARRPSP